MIFGLPGDPTEGRLYERSQAKDGTIYGAVFSPDRLYRYALIRLFPSSCGALLTFVMLNPSTAHGRAGDTDADDATIRSCVRIAKANHFVGVLVVNLFSAISTDPGGLLAVTDPVGPLGDNYLQLAGQLGKTVILGWGSHHKIRALLRPRAEAVLARLHASGAYLLALGVNKDGEPTHPLYQPTSTPLVSYER